MRAEHPFRHRLPVTAHGWAGVFSFYADPAFRLSLPIGYSGERRTWERKRKMRGLVAASLGWKLGDVPVNLPGLAFFSSPGSQSK
jgi:hypothetical protein